MNDTIATINKQLKTLESAPGRTEWAEAAQPIIQALPEVLEAASHYKRLEAVESCAYTACSLLRSGNVALALDCLASAIKESEEAATALLMNDEEAGDE
jgi:hypothetical protein